MNENSKRVKELAVRLNNKSSTVVIDTITGLRNLESFAGAVQLLIELYDRSDNTGIKDAIRSFMNDLKGESVRMEVVEEIKKAYRNDTIEMIASSCWQSGLDYSEHALVFANVFAKGEYMIALECFTVLEESMHLLPIDTRENIIKIIKKEKEHYSREKSMLMQELIRMLG